MVASPIPLLTSITFEAPAPPAGTILLLYATHYLPRETKPVTMCRDAAECLVPFLTPKHCNERIARLREAFQLHA
jgi:hypothetical protein